MFKPELIKIEGARYALEMALAPALLSPDKTEIDRCADRLYQLSSKLDFPRFIRLIIMSEITRGKLYEGYQIQGRI